MVTIPLVPEGLDKDFTSWHDLVLRWKDEKGQARESWVYREDEHSYARIELRPVIVVGGTDASGERPEIVAEIPLESLVSIDVDDPEIRLEPDEDGFDREIGVTVPVARWVYHPDKGLLRFTA